MVVGTSHHRMGYEEHPQYPIDIVVAATAHPNTIHILEALAG